MEHKTIFLILILFYTLYTISKIFVSGSQIRFLKKFDGELPEFDAGELAKAKSYAVMKERFALFESLYDISVFCLWVFVGLYMLHPLLSASSSLLQATGVAAFLAIGFILELPMKIASVFWLDKKFGFTATTPGLFALDKLKEFLLTMFFGGALSFVSILFINSFELWWLFVFGLIAAFIIGANILYPNFIAPLFNKFEKLENSEITDGLKELAKKSGFELNEIYRVDAGKRDTRLNAYFAGIGKSKRVALYDTLIEKLSKEEIFGVVAHELGHFKHKHILSSMGTMMAAFFALCFLLGTIEAPFYNAIGLEKNGAGTVVVFMLFSSAALYFLMPLINFIYKRNEFEADAYAAKMGFRESMIGALKTLAKENKAFPVASKIKIFFDYTHPPITQRIEKLKAV